jgi:hypothetical protein
MRKINTIIWTVSLIRTGEWSFVSVAFRRRSVRLDPKQQHSQPILAEQE